MHLVSERRAPNAERHEPSAKSRLARLGLAAWLIAGGWTLTSATGAAQIRDLDGRLLSPLRPSAKANVLLLISSDCPISNSYAPEIQTLCRAFGAQGATCVLLYEDPAITAAEARAHLREYRYAGITAALDDNGALARAVHASVTPQAVVVDASGTIRYRGRIDNLYVDLGKRRRAATEHDLRDAVDAVLAGRPVPRAETEPIGCFISR